VKAGWQVRKIGDICQVMTGGTPSKSKPEYFGGSIKWLVSGDIHQREIYDCKGRITEAGLKNSNARLLPINSVMIALNGQGKTRGTVAILRTQATCNQSLICITPKEPDKLLPEYLYANLHGRYQEIRRMTGDSGNDRRGLNMGLIKNIEIPIAPLSEQQRIVAILDEAFDGIAKARANAEKNLQNARALFESHLQAVFAQSYQTSELVSLLDLATDITDGDHMPPPKAPSGIPFITIGNVDKDKNTIDFLDTFMVSREYFDRLKLNKRPRHGDVLYTVTGSFGIPIMVNEHREFCFQRHIGLIRPKPEVSSEWLYFLLMSPQIFKQAADGATGAAQKTVSLKLLRGFQVPRISLDHQRLIAAKLKVVSEETQCLTSLYQRKLAALDELKQSLLHQAFSGEL
jgi:type I restriction enzyme S subunit